MNSHVKHRTPWSVIVPAAGASTRFGASNKLLQPLGASTVIEHVVTSVSALAPDCVVVVTGEAHDDIERLAAPLGAVCVFNPEHRRGMGRSIALGVEAASGLVASDAAYLIWPGDMPWIDSDSVQAVVSAGESGRIVIPVHGGRRGHPVLFSAQFRGELLCLDGERGARSVIEQHPDCIVELPVEDAAIHRDVDTVEDLGGGKMARPIGNATES
jgi:molybdenum cofactor cytidylyltransferase